MKNIYLVLILLPSMFYAQSNQDSLWNVWSDVKRNDTTRLAAFHHFIWNGYLFSNPDSAFYFAQKQYDFAEKTEQKKYMASSLNIQATTYYVKSDFTNAIIYFNKSLKIKEDMGDFIGVAGSYNNLGIIYKDQGQYAKAIECLTASLLVYEEVGDKESEARPLNNIGLIYMNQGNNEKAIEYYSRSVVIQREIENHQGLSSSLNNLGLVYENEANYDKALVFFKEALESATKVQDKQGISRTLANIGLIHNKLKEYDLALEYFEKVNIMGKELGDHQHILGSLVYMGNAYKGKKNLIKAKELYEEALQIAMEIGMPVKIRESSEALWLLYREMGMYKESLEMHELYVVTRDSILSDDNSKEIIKQEFRYNYEKKVFADSIETIQSNKLRDAELEAVHSKNEKQEIEAEQQLQQKYFLYGGLGLALLFGGFIFNRFKVTSKQKSIIEEQKSVVEKQKSAVEIQKVELEETHAQLAEHHKEIADSIMYAKRIQEAIMPSMPSMKVALNEGFVLYLPKDVVAGDFFWMEQLGDVTYYAAADCTGHGVPGAMVSVVCSNALNKALLEEGYREPGELLDRTREIVIDSLAKSGEEVKDGMDISLCALNLKTNQLKWSGANNPIWILRKEGQEIEEIKANKQPIGLFHAPQPFTTHTIEISNGDSIYVFTDGYQDQFGGEKGKKFKAQQLKDLIIINRSASMDDQMNVLKSKFMSWKGELEQIDDVCMIGVRV